MTRFLFRFGYCTPAQWQANEEHGWDDECSGAFFVMAMEKQQALAWGQEVVEGFVRRLFEEAGWQDIPSWKDSEFSYWQEDNPQEEFTQDDLVSMPEVRLNELPDFAVWDC